MRGNNFDVSYSHAAPFIREKLIGAVRTACESTTKKGRQAGFALAFGYADSLSILADSGDTVMAEGVHQLETYTPQDLARVRRFLSDASNYEKLMGLPPIEPATDEWYR